MANEEIEEHLLPLLPDGSGQSTDLYEMVERFSLVFERFGFQRMAGRIFSLMLLREEPMVTQAELAEDLQASTGSISTMIRLLEQLGFVERVSLPGHRSDRFRLTDDPLVQMTIRRLDRMEQVINIIQAARRSAQLGPNADERLAKAEDFYQFALDNIGDMLEAWARSRGDTTD